jgi:hypothetical protein
VADFVAENLLPDDELELMGMFLRDSMEYTLVTHNLTHRNRHVTAYDTAIGREPNEVRVRSIVSDGRAFVNSDWLRQWCSEKGLSQAAIIQRCLDAGVIERPGGVSGTGRIKRIANLNAGTARANEGAKAMCYLVNARMLARMLGEDVGASAESADVIEMRRPEPAESPQQEATGT